MKMMHRVMIGWVAMMVALAAPVKASWIVYDCGTLGGNQTLSPGTMGLGLSDNQCVVGVSIPTSGRWQAFRYTRATRTNSFLRSPTGYNDYGRANAISPDGTKVVGIGYLANNQPAILWTNNGTTVWAAMVLPFPFPASSLSATNRTAYAVNNAGIVVGSAFVSVGYDIAPLVWHPGDQGSGWTYDAATRYSYKSLPFIPSALTTKGIGYALSMNSNNMIGGECKVTSGYSHAAVWMPDGSGGYTAYNLNLASPIENKNGKVYGIAWDSSIGKYRAVGCFQESTKFTPWSWTYDSVNDKWDSQGSLGALHTPAAAVDAFAYSVNEACTVVGQSLDAAGEPRAFIWDAKRGMRDLNALLEGPAAVKWSLRYAQGISADGCICGYGYYDVNGDGIWATDKSETRAFLLVPARGTSVMIQ